jgi:hypothetical protein
MTATLEPVSQQLDAENPWPGLDSFSEEGEDFFHGRDLETAELLSRVKRDVLTVLHGQSGLGKTSLLNAGLFPRLRQEDFLPVYVRLAYSAGSPAPMVQISARIFEECEAHDVEAPPHKGIPSLWEYLHLANTAFWSPRNRVVIPVVVLDQFEEIFTLGRETRSDHTWVDEFVDALGDLVTNRPPARVLAKLESSPEGAVPYAFRRSNYRFLLSLREDYLADLESLQERMRVSTANRLRLTHMSTSKALESVIEAGRDLVHPPVARAIVAFTLGIKPGDLPTNQPLPEREVEPALLSVFCRELNEKRREKGEGRIELDLLAGSQEAILVDFYERSLTGVDPGIRRFIEERLLTETGYRNSRALEEVLQETGVASAAIDALVQRRLLRREERFNVIRVELTHDVLTKVVKESRTRRRLEEERLAMLAAQEAAAAKARERREAALGELARAQRMWEEFKTSGNQHREAWQFARLSEIESVVDRAIELNPELEEARAFLASVHRLFAETGIKTSDLNLASIYLQKLKNTQVAENVAIANLAAELEAAWSETDPRRNKFVAKIRAWALHGIWLGFLGALLVELAGSEAPWLLPYNIPEIRLPLAVLTVILHFFLALLAVMASAGEDRIVSLTTVASVNCIASFFAFNLVSLVISGLVGHYTNKARMARILWTKRRSKKQQRQLS